MNPFDPRLAVIVGVGTAVVSSHRVRAVIGRGAGYAAAGAMRVSGTVVNAGRDIYEEASDVAASQNNAGRKAKPRAKVAK
jgi:hypothetical protein